MKSTSGAYFVGLDQVRALAVFMVVTWHFTHAYTGYPVPFEYVPGIFPFALLDEGHTGVALFMTLSGYLFAKLLDGKTINYAAFFWNRVLRLFPLLAVILLIDGIAASFDHTGIVPFLRKISTGFIAPVLPNGAWSITVEFHFYFFVLPVFLWVLRRSKLLPVFFIVLTIAFRWFLYYRRGEIQSLGYWTIVGRVDQFGLGIILYAHRSLVTKRHLTVAMTLIGFSVFYWFFDSWGGFYHYPSYPSTSLLWVVLPTIEGLAYSIFIAWYDTSFAHRVSGVARFIALIGEYSYSIYLLHFFFVFRAAVFVNQWVMTITNFYLACLWSGIFVIAMMPIAYLSFRFIEAPFLRLRKPYILAQETS